MLNFSEITQINIPEGEVIKIEIDAITVWEKPTVWDYIIHSHFCLLSDFPISIHSSKLCLLKE